MTDWKEIAKEFIGPIENGAEWVLALQHMAEEIARLRAEIRNWKWVPETLAGQKFDSENVAHAYLRDEFKGLRAKLAEVTRERDEYKQASEKHAQIYSESASILHQKLSASEAREIALRKALEHIAGNRGNLLECCRKAFHDDQLDNHDAHIADEALAAQDPPPLLGVLREVEEALEVYASRSNWYEKTKNGRIEFHDGSDLNPGFEDAEDALAKLRAAIGGGG